MSKRHMSKKYKRRKKKELANRKAKQVSTNSTLVAPANQKQQAEDEELAQKLGISSPKVSAARRAFQNL